VEAGPGVEGRLSVASEQKKVSGHVAEIHRQTAKRLGKAEKNLATANWQLHHTRVPSRVNSF